jgi:hypothetical protein
MISGSSPGPRQPLASIDRRLVGAAPRFEELHQLLARAVIVPLAVALDDFEQLVGRLGAIALGVKRGREVESRLMVERVCGDLLLQLGHRTDCLGLLGEVDRGLHRLDGGVIALGFRHHRQRLLGLFERARRHVAFRQPGKGRDIGGVEAQHLGIDLRRGGGIAFCQHGLGLLQDLGDIRFARRRHALGEFVDEGVDLALRHRAHEAVGGLAAHEGDHGRDRLNAHLAGDGRMLVDIHLDQLDLALGRADRLFENGRELSAGSAPGRPEIDQHRLALRFLDDVLHEGLRGRLLDQIGCCLRRRAAALLNYRHGVLA